MSTTQEQQNQILDFYLNHNNPNTDPQAFYDVDQQAAERAAAAGGQSFSGARRGLLRRSQILENLSAAQPILAQRASFEQQGKLQTQAEQADLVKLAQAGEQAKQQEMLSQQGQLAHDTREAAAQRADTILRAQDAILQLQQTQQGDQILKQMGITADRDAQERALANSNWQLQTENAFKADQAGQERNFTSGQNALNRGAQFNIAGLNANAHVAGARISNPTYDKNATMDAVNQIIASTSGAGPVKGSVASPDTATANAGYNPLSGVSQDYSGNPPAAPQANAASYYFGVDSPQTNQQGQDQFGNAPAYNPNAAITDENFYVD